MVNTRRQPCRRRNKHRAPYPGNNYVWPKDPTWIFHAQVGAIALRIEAATSDWKKHKTTDSGDRILSKLSPLRTDVIDQMSNIEEIWKDTVDRKVTT